MAGKVFVMAAFALLVLLIPASSQSGAPSVALSVGPAVLHEPVPVTAVLSGPFGENLLQNASFSGLGTVWKWGGSSEVGVAPSVEGGNGSVTLAVEESVSRGSVYLYQQVLRRDRAPLQFSVSAEVEGEIEQFLLLVREFNSTGGRLDTLVPFPADSVGPLQWTWTPRMPDSVAFNLYLRYIVEEGRSAAVTFSDVWAAPSPVYSWEVDGVESAGTTPGIAPVFHGPGLHRVRVDVEGAGGVSAAAVATFVVQDPGLLPSEVPLVAPLGLAGVLDGDAVRHATLPVDLSTNGVLTESVTGWTFRDDETGGGGTWEAQEGFARMSVDAVKRGSVYAFQAAPAVCTEVPCRFSFEYRTRDEAPQMQLLLRQKVPDGADGLRTADARIEPPATGSWEHHEVVWAPASDAKNLQVYLRFIVDAGVSTHVDFRNVRLGPAWDHEWRVSGPDGVQEASGDRPGLDFGVPGTYAWSVLATDPWGNAYDLGGILDVVGVEVFPALDGSLGLRVLAGTDPASVTFHGATSQTSLAGLGIDGMGVETMQHAGEDFAWIPRTSEVGSIGLVSGGDGHVWAVRDLRDGIPEDAVRGEVVLKDRSLGSSVQVRYEVRDPSVESASLVLMSGVDTVFEQGLTVRDGEIDQSVGIPLVWNRQSNRVAVEFTDIRGETTLDFLDVTVERAPEWNAWLLIIGAIAGGALAVIGGVVVFWRPRRGA